MKVTSSLLKKTPADKIKQMFRQAQLEKGTLDGQTVDYVCGLIDKFAKTSTFSSYYSHFKLFVAWCFQNDVLPWKLDTNALSSFVRHRLEVDKVGVQTCRGTLSGIRKFVGLFQWEFADNDHIIRFMFQEA